MNIKEVRDATRVGRFKVSNKVFKGASPVLYPKTLVEVEYDKDFDKNLGKQHLSIVYFFTRNGEIIKIGQTSAKSGFKDGCLSFYCNAGRDDCMINRFTINWLIREEIGKGNNIEVYFQYMKPIKINVNGIFGSRYVEVPISAKALEEACLEDYKISEKVNPEWNFQESGQSLPKLISEAFATYKLNRARAKK